MEAILNFRIFGLETLLQDLLNSWHALLNPLIRLGVEDDANDLKSIDNIGQELLIKLLLVRRVSSKNGLCSIACQDDLGDIREQIEVEITPVLRLYQVVEQLHGLLAKIGQR
ncbi:hypothetical protein HG530_008972 [Fusarium avenaceum]|nr:hypothetical protein HG530_008972 [Fusarium avenaceum]